MQSPCGRQVSASIDFQQRVFVALSDGQQVIPGLALKGRD